MLAVAVDFRIRLEDMVPVHRSMQEVATMNSCSILVV